jgi:hypothetical protein
VAETRVKASTNASDEQTSVRPDCGGFQRGTRIYFARLRRFDAQSFTVHSGPNRNRRNQIGEDAAGGGGGPGVPGIGSSSGMSPGNSSGLCGSPGSRTGGEISGLGFPGGSSGGGSAGRPGLIGGSSDGSIGIVSRSLAYAS